MKYSVLIIILMLICLCACTTKIQPEPTAVPTVTVVEPTTEPTADAANVPAAETSQNEEEKTAAVDAVTEAISGLQNVNGNTVKSQDIFGGHKITMLNIWATTYTACISEMPELIQLNKEFEKKGGQIVGLVFDAVEDDLILEAQEIVKDLNIDFLTLLPNDTLRKQFDAMSYPITYFINQKGEIVGEPFMGARVAGYREMMEKYLSEN